MLFGDLETYCEVPITHGTWRYAERAEIMLWVYAIDDGPVSVWDIDAGVVYRWLPYLDDFISEPAQNRPADLTAALQDPTCGITFHNAGFDRTILLHAGTSTDFAAARDLSRWHCSMARGLAHSLPGALAAQGEVLGTAEADRKIDGKNLVHLFCKPRPATSKIRRATRHTHPQEWAQFIRYAARDIDSMRANLKRMPVWNYHGRELESWRLDQRINERGVCVDLDLAKAAVRAAEDAQAALAEQTQDLTNGQVQAATQRDALLAHILSEHGVALPDMQASTLERRIEDPNLPPMVRELLAIRLQAGRNSASKYTALMRGVSSDGRLRGLLQWCGAARTGRWSGRLFQPQNLPRPDVGAVAEWFGIPTTASKYLKLRSAPGVDEHHIHEFIDFGIEAMKTGCERLLYSNVMALTASAVRGCLVAPPGRKLVVSDLANIEGRVAAWLAGESWKLQAFRDYDTILGVDAKGKEMRKGHDLYKLAYAKSFNCKPDDVTKQQRQIGKVQELMLQYEGGVGAYLTGALNYGIDLEEMAEQAIDVLPDDILQEAQDFLEWVRLEKRPTFGLSDRAFTVCESFKRGWRRAHPAIVEYWPALREAVTTAISNPGMTVVSRRLKMRRDGAWLRIQLPSGRALCYPSPKVDEGGKITYMGLNQYSRRWERLGTYGGKLLENITQAVSRDVMAWNMPAMDAAGYEIVLTVHDEVITEAPDSAEFTAEGLGALLASSPPWADGLPLAAGGFESTRYRKD